MYRTWFLLQFVVFASVAAAQGTGDLRPLPNVDFYGDALPAGAIARLGTTRFRHNGSIRDLRFTSDGKLLTAWSGHWFYLWDAQTGRRIRRAHLRGLFTLRTGDDTMLVANDKSQVLKPWKFTDPRSIPPPPLAPKPNKAGALVFRLAHLEDNPKVGHYATALSGGIVATATSGNLEVPREIRLWQIEPNKKFDDFQQLSARWRTRMQIRSLSFSGDGRYLAAFGFQGAIHQLMLCDLENMSRAKIGTVPPRSNRVRVSPDGKQIVVWRDLELLIYDFAASEPKHRLPIPQNENDVRGLAWSPDGKLIAGGGEGKRVCIWNAESDQPARQFDQQSNFVEHIVFSPDGKTLATSDGNSTAHLWDVATGRRIDKSPARHSDRIYDADLSFDGKWAATCSYDGTAAVWNATTGEQQFKLSMGKANPPLTCRFSPDGLFAAIANAEKLALYDVKSGQPGWTVSFDSKEQPWVRSISFSRDGKRLAAVANQRQAIVWEPHGTGKLCAIEPDAGATCIACLSPDGKTLVVATKTDMAASTIITIWDVDSQQLIKTLKPEKGNANSLQFSPDGKLLVMSGHSTRKGWVDNNRNISSPDFEDSVILWDVQSGKVVRKFFFTDGPTNVRIAFDVVFSPDGKYLITAERFGEVLIYETASGKHLVTVQAHNNPALALGMSADGKRLLSVGTDQTGIVWDFPALLRNQ